MGADFIPQYPISCRLREQANTYVLLQCRASEIFVRYTISQLEYRPNSILGLSTALNDNLAGKQTPGANESHRSAVEATKVPPLQMPAE